MKHPIHLMAALAVCLVAAASPAKALTAAESQTLPVQDLARRVLGDAGKIMVDVDRPKWDWRGPGPGYPPLAPVRFYSRATPIYGHFMSPLRFWGICEAYWVDVSFDDEGYVSKIESQTRYHIDDNLDCASGNTTRNYFPAPSEDDAKILDRYYSSIQEAFSKPEPLPFLFTCAIGPSCDSTRKFLKATPLSRFASARIVDCDSDENILRHQRKCYELSDGGIIFVVIKGRSTWADNTLESVHVEFRVGPH